MERPVRPFAGSLILTAVLPPDSDIRHDLLAQIDRPVDIHLPPEYRETATA
jgi:hypothetical protein